MDSYVASEDSEVQATKSGQGVIGVSRRADPCWTDIDSPSQRSESRDGTRTLVD